MNCKRCNKKIEENESYCAECKEVLEKESSDFNDLVEENRKLNELENTMEIDNLQVLVEEKMENIANLEDNNDLKKNNNKNKIIIFASILIFIVILIIIIFMLISNSNKKEEKQPIKIDYENVIKEYGDSLKSTLKKYLDKNNDIPSWSIINELTNYNKYNVNCNTHIIYENGNIYLDDCKVDNKEVKYSYGEKKEEIKGKEIIIYKKEVSNNNFIYNNEEGLQVGLITCETEECKFVDAYEKYVLISEENKYYIYDYETSSIVFGPFNLIDNNYENNMIYYKNVLYAVLYEEDGKKNIYSITSNKIFKNIKGDLLALEISLDPRIMYKYGYSIFVNNNQNNFVNLKTGNVSYTITGTINSFIEDPANNIVYITTYNSSTSKITIYNSNGKKLFDEKEYNNIKLLNDKIIVSNENNYYIYNSNLKLELTSKQYDNILGIYDSFIVVVYNEYLTIVDLNDNTLVTFDLKWDNNEYILNSNASGKFIENNNEEIHLVIENNGKSLKYYYIPTTGEFGLK